MSNGIKYLLLLLAVIAVFVFVPGFFKGIKTSCSNVVQSMEKSYKDLDNVKMPSLKGK